MNMFAAFLERSTARPAANGAASQKRGRKSGRTFTLAEFRSKLELGQRIARFYEERHGVESLRMLAKPIEQEDSLPRRRRFPWGFLKDFIETDMGMAYTDAKRMQCARCFDLHLDRSALGGESMISRLNGIHKNAKNRRDVKRMP